MALRSFQPTMSNGQRCPPRIRLLQVRDPTDVEADRIEWLLVEAMEAYERDGDGTISRAQIDLRYQVVTSAAAIRERACGDFGARYTHMGDPGRVSLSDGGVFIDPARLRGRRVGTYLMNAIVLWAKQWPDAVVNPITLLELQADQANKERRNRFYERFGLVFDYTDGTQRAGLSQPIRAIQLKECLSWRDNIEEQNALDGLARLLDRSSGFPRK